MKQSLSNCIQSHEEMYDWDFYTLSLLLEIDLERVIEMSFN